MKFVSLLIVAIAVECASAFVCPHKDGFYRHESDAHKFYECVNGNSFEYTCPAGLVFNLSIQACDYTTGPDIHVTTEGTVTPPTGTRHRHTDPVTEPQTEPVTHDDVTTETGTFSPTEPSSTRGRHTDGY